MKYSVSTVFLSVAISSFCSFSTLAEVAVVVHPSNQINLTKNEIKRIYLGKMKNFANGQVILPIDLSEGDKTRNAFNKQLLGKSSSQIKAYWSKLIFTGKGTPPKNVRSESEVISAVAANPGTIGYVEASQVTDQVRVIVKF
ncbi:substrate-binding domain-containing protein [Pseudoalteromonas aurantia]|uniref:Phosphate ABC transporter substrate-binding protein n=2 Tax=Pseudoalteromonas TaxID=53246 RepID=A0ABY2W1G8_9GAMM|nr:substrate-binding domain-containing protein [Pseudoalteromonas aurantia]TMO64458.1 phosphate ABC transporter substrate-binding protein [Pseudoalteromonas aurantia]TMO77743.1 phosphate ABC transporter substrate-binding protein [Pseudoalteromonas aurantia]